MVGVLGIVDGCGRWSDRLACGDDGCLWTRDEWARVVSLAGLPDRSPPPDQSNRWAEVPAAATLGHKLYFDSRLSGEATWVDSLGRPAPTARADKKGDAINISCATCHDPARFGSDFTSRPSNVSVGAGWYDVNAQQTLNTAFFSLLYWNGRTDALWAQAAQVIESAVSMNGDRLNTFRIVATYYRNEYTSIFCASSDPSDQPATDNEGCPLPAGDALDTTRFPLHGRPETAPFDEMSAADRALVTRVHVNASKAIAAYERLLQSGESAFDRYARLGPASGALAPAAERGLKLFIGRASCIDCHNTPLLSDQKFHNIGVPQRGTAVPTVAACSGTSTSPKCDCSGATGGSHDDTCLPWGAYAGALRRAAGPEFSRGSRYSDQVAPIEGAGNEAGNEAESMGCGVSDAASSSTSALDSSEGGRMLDARCKGAWRTPSLRDVAMTAPYMHDGVFTTLSDVIWHYDQAEGTGSELAPLNLSHQERDDLAAFLESLTGAPGAPDIIATPDLPGQTPLSTSTDAGTDGAPNLNLASSGGSP